VNAGPVPLSETLSGLPPWITAELIGETIAVWQPKYAEPLTERDAIEILLNVAALMDALGDADVDAVSGPGASF
jgi:hypothetical protein